MIRVPLKSLELQETELVSDQPVFELAASQTSLAFERTRMSADKMLMGIVQTSLALIGFGFTIHSVFRQLADTASLPLNEASPRNFGLALILIGIVILVLGIGSHTIYRHSLAVRHERLFKRKLVRQSAHYGPTATLVAAVGLLLVGIAAFAVIIFNTIS